MPGEGGRRASLTDALKAVFDLAQEDRERWLLEHCDDPVLRQEVLALCRGGRQSPGLLDRSLDELADGLIEPEDGRANAMLGTRVGAWEVTDLLGEGGMATVWLGERREGDFDQQVAIKCLKAAVAGPAYARLFERERQILANLDSPGIARLLDGGITDEGVPYIVMERVNGDALVDACAAGAFDLNQCLRLFVKVCDIVQYAHQKLVVHRDLKPANILIDDQGRPRLLDFGVAGLIDEASGDPSVTRSVALTPAYAAPEQIDGQVAGVTADVYALGVILCELLTGGQRPHAGVGDGDDPITRRNTWPSRLVSETEGRDALWIRRRSSKLRGDLDAIVLKCLRRNPAQRYASVADLARELRNHLSQQPVGARRGHLGYRATLFMRRHAIWLVSAALFVVVLVGALLWTIQENRQTEAALAESRATQAFLVRLFESNVPVGAASTLPSTQELLQRGAERARTDFDDNPALRVRMLTTIGDIYRRLDRYEEARSLLREAMMVAKAQAALGEPVADLATRFQLGFLAFHEGRYVEAEEILEAVVLEQRQQGVPMEVLAQSMRTLGGVHMQLGQHQRAIALERKAVALLQNAGAAPLDLANARNDLGTVLFKAREYQQAIAVLRATLEYDKRTFGEVHKVTNIAAANLAAALGATGHNAEALRIKRKVVARDGMIYRQPNRQRAIHLRGLGAALIRDGQLLEARAALEQARAMVVVVFGADHPRMAAINSMLGTVAFRRGHYAESAQLQRRALKLFQARQGAPRYAMAAQQSNLARALVHLEKWDQARPLAAAALQLKTRLRGADDRSLTTTLAVLAHIERHAGDFDAARTLLRRALELEGEARYDTVKALTWRTDLAYVDCLDNKQGEALAAFDAILASVGLHAVQQPLARARTLSRHGDCLQRLGRSAQAREAWRQSLNLREGHLPADFPDSVRLRKALQPRNPANNP